MSRWIKFGCFITGWNKDILKSCSEASFKTLRKYTSAILILIILWAFTGYFFTQRYLKTPDWVSIISAVLFVVVVVQIERQIIMTSRGNKFAMGFRIFIAIIMALLGSTIIDQFVFGNDIEQKSTEMRDLKVQELLPNRISNFNKKTLEIELASVKKEIMKLREKIDKTPYIKKHSGSTTRTRAPQTDGTTSMQQEQITDKYDDAPNPLNEELNSKKEDSKRLEIELSDVNKKIKSEEDNLRKELKEKTGFIEEISAMIALMKEHPVAIVFWVILILFFVSLEIFVVISKILDKCDYDLIVEHQYDMKKAALKRLTRDLNN